MSPRGKLQNEHMRADTQAKITGAALEIFAEYGYNGATMKQIALASGLSYGLVYHYFPSKEAVFRTLVDVALESSISTIVQGLDGSGTAWEKIVKLSELMVENAFTGTSSLYFLIMMQALTQGKGIPGLLPHIEGRSREHYAKLVVVIMQAQEDGNAVLGDPTVLTAAYFSFIQGLSLLVFGGQGMEKKITPEILLSVLKK